jgi:hypothetical protein
MSDPIDFAQTARRLRRSAREQVGVLLASRMLGACSIKQPQIEAKANIRKVILFLEETATKLRVITSMLNLPKIAFGEQN